ncbi:MAG: serine/threonine protein kinase, partial [Gemmatimonadaceae bacterium]
MTETFADTYRIEDELRGGGMSRLFRATELAADRRLVIKILPPELTSNMMAARFKRECAVAAVLKHPNILSVITSGVKDGLMYYVMPFVPGQSLRERLLSEKQLPVEDAIGILSEVASA